MIARLMVATILLAVMLVPGLADAQMPWIGVFFDTDYQYMQKNCQGIDVLDTLHIALFNAEVFVSGVEFAVNYPPQILFLADVNKQPVSVGTTATGFSQGWGIPANGFSPVYVCGAQFLWKCDNCVIEDIEIVVVEHPHTGVLGFTNFPDYKVVPAVGMTSLICATVPTEETTWGQIKSLYSE